MIVKPFLYCYNILLVNLKLHLYHFALAILILNIFFFFQPWEGKVLGKRRNGDTFLQNVNIIPVIGKGG